MEKKFDSKIIYFVIGCVCFVLFVVGATYAYFTAKATDDNTIKGNAATVSFGLSVDKVTSIDMAYGLVPMKNSQAPNAAINKCDDDFGRAGCQIYKITINADSDTVMFLDGYIETTPKVPELETRFVQIYTDDEEVNFYTKFSNDDYMSDGFNESEFIKAGKRVSDVESSLNRTDDADCLLISDEQVGGEIGRKRVFYVMLWVYDNGEAQDYLQGMELAYKGKVTFTTAEGNEISATFD